MFGVNQSYFGWVGFDKLMLGVAYLISKIRYAINMPDKIRFNKVTCHVQGGGKLINFHPSFTLDYNLNHGTSTIFSLPVSFISCLLDNYHISLLNTTIWTSTYDWTKPLLLRPFPNPTLVILHCNIIFSTPQKIIFMSPWEILFIPVL